MVEVEDVRVDGDHDGGLRGDRTQRPALAVVAQASDNNNNNNNKGFKDEEYAVKEQLTWKKIGSIVQYLINPSKIILRACTKTLPWNSDSLNDMCIYILIIYLQQLKVSALYKWTDNYNIMPWM